MAVVIEDAQTRRDARIVDTLHDIEEIVDAVDLQQCLADNAELETAFMRAIRAAADTGLEAKRRLLATVVSAAVLDDARVDEAALMVQVLQELDAPHFRALERIRREQAIEQDRSGEPPKGGWPSSAQHVVDLVNQESQPVVAALLRAGTLQQVTGDSVWGGGGLLAITGLTPFGQQLIHELKAHGNVDGVSRGAS